MVMLELNELRHDQRIQWETRYHMNQDTLHWITTIVDEEEPTTLVGLLTTCIKSKRWQLCCPVGLVVTE